MLILIDTINKTKIDQIPILNFSKFLDGDEKAKVALASDLKWIQEKIGLEKAGSLIENAMGSIAKALVDSGVRRLVVAGGETAGAVVGALGISSLQIGEQIDPGVPGTITVEDPKIAFCAVNPHASD